MWLWVCTDLQSHLPADTHTHIHPNGYTNDNCSMNWHYIVVYPLSTILILMWFLISSAHSYAKTFSIIYVWNLHDSHKRTSMLIFTCCFVFFFLCACIRGGKGRWDKGRAMSQLRIAQRNSIYHIVQFCHFSICVCVSVSVCMYAVSHNRTFRRKRIGSCKISIAIQIGNKWTE